MISNRREVARGSNAGDNLGLWDDAAGQSSKGDSTTAARVLSSRILTLRKNIPAELRERRQWVAARITPDPDQPGKTKKVPIDPRTGKAAKSNDSATWGSFEDAVMRMTQDGLQAVGYVFAADDPYCGIDFDHVYDADGNLEQWVRDYLRLLNGYAERSQSGTGVHVIVRATLPPGGRHGEQVEVYDRVRFFVTTGDVIDGYSEIRDAQDAVNTVHRETFGAPKPTPKPTRQPAQPVNLADAELLAKAQAAVNGAKFTALWHGNTAAYDNDHSDADAALCALLGFWTAGDAGRVDRLFRQSGLMRDKWDERHDADGRTYGEMTVTNALARVIDFYDGNGRQPPDLSYAPDREPADPPAWLDDEGAELAYAPKVTRDGWKVAKPPAPKVGYQTSWTPAELLSAVFPEPVWAVPDVITVGLTLLAGRPKVGKSWLANQTALAVGTGGMVLDRRVTRGKVLYLALEDNARRLQKRAMKQGMPSDAAIRYELAWPLFTHDGIERLDAAITEQGYTLVIVDTIGRALGRADTQDWTDMNAYVGELQQLAHTHDVAILCLDHHRKPTGFAGDPVDDIVGSTAKSAVADCLIGLYREQGKPGAKLSIRGRDIEDAELALTFDKLTCSWQYAGTAEEMALRGNRGKIIDALRANDAPMTLTEIAESTGGDKGNLHSVVNDLVTEGVVERLPKQGREVPYRLK